VGRATARVPPCWWWKCCPPATSAYDRGAKFAAYRKLPTLREYALIDPERLSLDLFRREGDSKRWVLHPIEAGGHVEWASVGLQVPLEVLYEDVPMTTGPQPHPAPDQA
jgi:Uma2 family endonuclease